MSLFLLCLLVLLPLYVIWSIRTDFCIFNVPLMKKKLRESSDVYASLEIHSACFAYPANRIATDLSGLRHLMSRQLVEVIQFSAEHVLYM